MSETPEEEDSSTTSDGFSRLLDEMREGRGRNIKRTEDPNEIKRFCNFHSRFMAYGKVRVKFQEESSVDWGALVNDLQSDLDIGLAGLFKFRGGISVFVQANDRSLSLFRIKKICTKVGGVVEVVPFDAWEEEPIESFHEFNFRGLRRKVQPSGGGAHFGFRVKPEIELKVGGKAYACFEIPLRSDQVTFSAVYGSSDGVWSARFWVGPIIRLGAKDKKRVSDDQKTALLERQNNLCQECSCPVFIGSYSNADIDHIVPRHLGGMSVLNNLQVICVPCHRTKTGLESKAVKRMFPGLELEPNGRMYAVSNDRPHDFRDGTLNPLKFME